MQVTPNNFHSVGWIKSDLSYDESKQIKSRIDNLSISFLDGTIEYSEYKTKKTLLLDRIFKNSFMFGVNYDLFLSFLLKVYTDKEKAKRNAEHEKQHADCLVKKGIKNFSFGLKVFLDGGVQPFVYFSEDVNLNTMVPTSQLNLYKEINSAPHAPSESDLLSVKLLSKSDLLNKN
jgi:hypothetical protein